MNVKGYDNGSKTPTLKTKLKDLLLVNGLLEDVSYIIKSIKTPEEGDDAPKVGESICIRYNFKPYEPGSFGYEHLSLFIGRSHKTGRNYVRYFESIDDLKVAISNYVLEVDLGFNNHQVEMLQKRIDTYNYLYQRAIHEQVVFNRKAN